MKPLSIAAFDAALTIISFAAFLASATAQVVDTTGVSVSVSGNEVTTTKRAGTNNITTSVTVTPYGVMRTDTYEGSGRKD